ncbi:uncharacterized protein LOC113305130 [Papaver somniferum]|uniref:uncharacterized protein LOC113305130 n=1 Tax=Papaver somniferum TaxID=3469 RepID=UPI000E6F69C8|nr:uncharacterized protein LOC113305130 [Papaver somniferum]
MNKGGLGVKNLKLTNLALLSKWIWRYTGENEALWRRIVQEKCKGNKDVYLPVDDNSSQGRSFWKNILKTSHLVQKNCTFQVKNGKATRFWYDKWCTNGVLKDRYPAAFKACKNKNASIVEMVVNGRLVCNTRRSMNGAEQLQ